MFDSDDTPFNPFYIGPHPSKACVVPEVPGQQCSPPCQDCKDSPKEATEATPAAPAQGARQATEATPAAPAQGAASGLLIVGMVGPSGGMATIYSTTEVLVAAAKAAGSSPENPCAGKKMIECMQGKDKTC